MNTATTSNIKKWRRLSNTDHAKIIEVIQVRSVVGTGVEGDPFRQIYEYWSKAGELLARRDSDQKLEQAVPEL